MPRLSKIGAAALAAFGWTSGTGAATTVTASYLIVAGGGGGGGFDAGGGGAGGFQTGTTSLNLTLSYTVIVGAGGVNGVGSSASFASYGGNGSNSTFGTLTASIGGGGGGAYSQGVGLAGGSGGGGGGASSIGSVNAGGAGTSGQGYAGGSGLNNSTYYPGGGGGGAGGLGGNATAGTSGVGGVGLTSSISGTSTYYAGGGSGGAFAGSAGTPGNGGGGTGGINTTAGTAGTANLGGGGGGGPDNTNNGGRGGSGVVIISYSGAQQFSGGVVTYVSGSTIHTFNTSGTLSPVTPSLSTSYLVVAGGGAGGAVVNGPSAGGAGAGGLLASSTTIDTNSIYLVTVGAGGAGSTVTQTNGSASSFYSISSTGGGAGGGIFSGTGSSTGQNGGSGGGGYVTTAGGTGISGQGNNGSSGVVGTAIYTSGAGGGAGSAGNAGTVANGGNGGSGTASSISGSSVTYAGGGGGGATAVTPGTGGSGGGGAGGQGDATGGAGQAGFAGTANTGGGGGGAGGNNYYTATQPGGNGGSGIVIISYAGTQQMAGGTVTSASGNTIHTFTSSGYLTPLTLVSNSLRFRRSASAYLTRTPSVNGSLTTVTWSFWVKRGLLASSISNEQVLYNADPSNSNTDYFAFGQGNGTAADNLMIQFNGAAAGLVTTPVYRDPAAWYHVVIAIDTTQATASNRVKFYVNGVQITSFNTANYPSQNYNFVKFNRSTYQQVIAAVNSSTSLFDGELAEFRFIDGQQLTPTSFGGYNQYGVWQPAIYGGSYGTNGFYLPFTANRTANYSGAFNGSSQYIGLPANSVFNLGTGNFTAEAWVNTNVANAYQSIIDFWPNASGSYLTGQWQFGTDNAGHLAFYITTSSTSAGNVTISTTATYPLNTWFHIAAVRSGTTITLYLNGVSVGSTTFSGQIGYSSTTGSLGRQTTGSNYVAGYISNARITNTAVYTSVFTPSTTALTAISGTQLLTLQNSTLVDNSTNALSLTNGGSTTFPVQYPFNTSVFNDQGPAGNNWTPNNIQAYYGGYQSGYDYMTDVPTLTSATAANYCVLNPLVTPATTTIINGNLGMSGYTPYSSATGSLGVSSGKWYFEFVAQFNAMSGITGTPNGSYYPGQASNSYAWDFANATKYSNNTGASYGAATSAGDIVGVAFNLDSGSITFYKNNVSQGVAYTFTPSGFYFPVVRNGDTVNTSVNFGQQPFVYTPPSGYLALNTYNL